MVNQKKLNNCKEQKNLCVMSSDNFLNTSCLYLSAEESFTCRWIQTNNVRLQTISSFIFSKVGEIHHCQSILNKHSTFNLTIKSVIGQKTQFSEVYLLIIKHITQAPQPLITSVNATETSINVTWNSREKTVTKCKIRYRRLNTESWTETADFPASIESQYVIEGLQVSSEYHLSVSCVLGYGRWSNWSNDTRVKTSESLPSAALSLSYYVYSDGKTQQLLLLWKALDFTDARGLIQGYEVSYMPIKQPSQKKTIHTTHLKVVVPVRSEEYDVSVCAYNSVGRSPYRRITVNASDIYDLPPVKSLWVYSDGSSLQILWEHEFTMVNVSEFAIEWGTATDRIEAQQTYVIGVFPIYESLCGPSTLISADLQHGALLDLVRFRVVNVTSSSVAVEWTWQNANPSVSVLHYKLLLTGPNDTQSLTVLPYKQQHSFVHLRPNTKYSIHIHGRTADRNFSKASLDVNTLLLDYDEMMRFAVPVILLLVLCGIFSVLTRNMCREYFSPIIANPRYSLIGRWLLNPHLQICVLKLDSVFLLDQQMEKSIIQVERRVSLPSDHEDVLPPKIPETTEGTALWKPSSDYVENTQTPSIVPEYVDLPLLPHSSGYVQNGQIPNERIAD
ncbi:Interleukin-6 receptor subunit beta [Labeo rohita]|uniref:Interleukin-6 receptor subunit beta n=1 Tax=Labeo rohita TaxID=84645 RepID=A0ABQ8MGE1_LABRO|nr:Interleukin-6 receptor subunit beta [Labeo rohita]